MNPQALFLLVSPVLYQLDRDEINIENDENVSINELVLADVEGLETEQRSKRT